MVANGVGSRAPFLMTRIAPPCWATKIRPSAACANAVALDRPVDPGLVAGEAARLRDAAAELHQRRRPGGDVARGVARPRPQHVLAAGVEAGVDGGGVRRGGVDRAEGQAVDLELDRGHADVVAGRGREREHAGQAGGEVGRARSASPSARWRRRRRADRPSRSRPLLVVAAPCESVARAVRLCTPVAGRRPGRARRGCALSSPSRVAPSKNSTLATVSSLSAAVAVSGMATPMVPVAARGQGHRRRQVAAGVVRRRRRRRRRRARGGRAPGRRRSDRRAERFMCGARDAVRFGRKPRRANLAPACAPPCDKR